MKQLLALFIIVSIDTLSLPVKRFFRIWVGVGDLPLEKESSFNVRLEAKEGGKSWLTCRL